MEKIIESKHRIRFQDCDPFKHLNNSKYIDYFINAREDQIKEYYGIDMYAMIGQTNNAWVVGSNQISYLAPARLMEEIVIESKLINFSPKSIQVEMMMWNKDKTKLKALYWVKFIYISLLDQKSTNHPEELMDLFSKVKVELPNQIFEERIAGIMSFN